MTTSEDRITRLEAAYEFLKDNMATKEGIATLSGRMEALDARMTGRMDSLETRLDGRMDSLEARLDGGMSSMSSRMDALEARMDARMDSMEARLNGRWDGLHGSANRLPGVTHRFDGIPPPHQVWHSCRGPGGADHTRPEVLDLGRPRLIPTAPPCPAGTPG